MLANVEVESQSEGEEENVYTVERIIDEGRRIINGKPCLAYKVLWEGWPESDATWEPKANLKHCKEILKEWEDLKKCRADKQAKQKPAQHIQPKLSTFLANTSSSSSSSTRDANLKKWQRLVDDAECTIRVENKIDNDGPPKNFQWSENINYGDFEPDPDTAIGCECKGGVCKSSCACNRMTNDANQKESITYKAGRLVRKHALGGIFECNINCSCDQSCPNRVVQKGRKIPLDLFKTLGKGWGVRTPNALKAGTFVTKYAGELLTSEEAEKRGQKVEKAGESSYLFDIDFHRGEDEDDDVEVFTLDAKYFGNIGRFFNHSCDPNCKTYPVAIETADPRYFNIVVFTTRDVKAGEELTINYCGGGFEEDSDDEDEQEDVVEVTARKSPGRRNGAGAGSKRKATTVGGGKGTKVPKTGRESRSRKTVVKNGHHACYCGAAKCSGVMPFSHVKV